MARVSDLGRDLESRTALGSHARGTVERGQGGSWLSDPERPGERGLGALGERGKDGAGVPPGER